MKRSTIIAIALLTSSKAWAAAHGSPISGGGSAYPWCANQATAVADGCAAANPNAAFVNPTFFTDWAQNGQTFSFRPSWNLPGVNYPVGYDVRWLTSTVSGTPNDPATYNWASLNPGCSYSASGAQGQFGPRVICTMGANNYSWHISGFDWVSASTGKCTQLFLNMNGNSTGSLEIDNNYWHMGASPMTSTCNTNDTLTANGSWAASATSLTIASNPGNIGANPVYDQVAITAAGSWATPGGATLIIPIASLPPASNWIGGNVYDATNGYINLGTLASTTGVAGCGGGCTATITVNLAEPSVGSSDALLFDSVQLGTIASTSGTTVTLGGGGAAFASQGTTDTLHTYTTGGYYIYTSSATIGGLKASFAGGMQIHDNVFDGGWTATTPVSQNSAINISGDGTAMVSGAGNLDVEIYRNAFPNISTYAVGGNFQFAKLNRYNNYATGISQNNIPSVVNGLHGVWFTIQPTANPVQSLASPTAGPYTENYNVVAGSKYSAVGTAIEAIDAGAANFNVGVSNSYDHNVIVSNGGFFSLFEVLHWGEVLSYSFTNNYMYQGNTGGACFFNTGNNKQTITAVSGPEAGTGRYQLTIANYNGSALYQNSLIGTTVGTARTVLPYGTTFNSVPSTGTGYQAGSGLTDTYVVDGSISTGSNNNSYTTYVPSVTATGNIIMTSGNAATLSGVQWSGGNCL